MVYVTNKGKYVFECDSARVMRTYFRKSLKIKEDKKSRKAYDSTDPPEWERSWLKKISKKRRQQEKEKKVQKKSAKEGKAREAQEIKMKAEKNKEKSQQVEAWLSEDKKKPPLKRGNSMSNEDLLEFQVKYDGKE